MTIELAFDNPLSVSQAVPPANVRIRAADSTDVGVLSVSPPPPDTTEAVKKLGRPVPGRSLIVKVSRPLHPKTTYRIRVTDVRNLMGVARSGEILLTTPATIGPPPKPAGAAAAPPPPVPPPAASPIKR